jgi:hypothetical protein
MGAFDSTVDCTFDSTLDSMFDGLNAECIFIDFYAHDACRQGRAAVGGLIGIVGAIGLGSHLMWYWFKEHMAAKQERIRIYKDIEGYNSIDPNSIDPITLVNVATHEQPPLITHASARQNNTLSWVGYIVSMTFLIGGVIPAVVALEFYTLPLIGIIMIVGLIIR